VATAVLIKCKAFTTTLLSKGGHRSVDYVQSCHTHSSAQGGHYSVENVHTYSASIGAIDTHMNTAREIQIQGLHALRGALTQEVGLEQ